MKNTIIPVDWKTKKDITEFEDLTISNFLYYMQDDYKSKEILSQIRYLEKLPISYERNILIARLKSELENTKKTFYDFKYIKHHIYMNIDIYEIIWKDLYWHFKRLLDTMNENNVCDLDKLDLKKSAKYIVKDKLITYWLIKEIKLKNNVNSKIYINPAFWLNNRVLVNPELEEHFREVNKSLYNLDLNIWKK